MKEFIFISTVVLAALLLAANGYSTEKNNFKITSWNIMALTSKPFKSVITGVNSTRIKIDYERISSYIGEIDADIISLQEISDINALDKILSPYGYKYMFSPRSENPSKRSENDIFTAIAVRDNDRIEFSPVQEIIGTSFETKSDRYTRSAIYTDIYFDKVYQFTFVAVHLKSGCSSTQKISKSSRGDCLTLHKQIKAIGKWAAEQKEKRIIYAGDFNR
ncbi:hypothetical protein QNE66_004387, partial [Vibrio vulnificus]|nr:hypothetical protein [Vibrio vulnificus]